MYLSKRKYFAILFPIFMLCSCKKDIHPSIEQDWLLPLATSEITLTKLLNDTLYRINNDSSISLVYNTVLADFKVDTLINLDNIHYKYGISLTSLKLNPYNFTYRISMGDIANKDKEINGPNGTIYTTIMTAHNTGQPTAIQSFGPYTYDSIKINTNQYFKYVEIKHAILNIKIKNNLPVPLTNISYEIKTSENNTPLISGSFSIVLPTTEESNSHIVENIKLDTLLLAKVTVSSPGSLTPVVIDTSQSAQTTIEIKELQVDSAIIKIPENEIIEYHDNALLNLPDSAQIIRGLIKEGLLKIVIYNTLNTDINLNFTLPDAKKNNQPFNTQIMIQAGTPIYPSFSEKIVDLSGYDVKFKGIGCFEQQNNSDLNNNGIIDADTCNKLYYHLKITPSSTDDYIYIGKKDSISLEVQLNSLRTKYIKGFFGYKNISIEDTVFYNLLSDFDVESFYPENIIINLLSENTIGTKAKCYIQQFKATNTKKNIYENLNGSILTTPFTVNKPVDPGFYQINNINPSISNLSITSNNSNVNSLIGILPDKFEYLFKLNLNEDEPLPVPANANDFIYDYSYIKLKANIEFPLWFSLKNAVLYDTAELSIKNINVDNISEGKLILYYYNYYPLSIRLNTYFLDSLKNTIDSLTGEPIIINCPQIFHPILPITQPAYNKIEIDMPVYKLKRILKSKYVAFKLVINTLPSNTGIKIFNSYSLKLKIIGDFSYLYNK